MAIEDTFNGARAALVFDHAWRNTVAQLLGMEKALAMETQICETLGTAQGKMIKERIGMDDVDIGTARQILTNLIKEGYGIDSEVIEENGNKSSLKVGRCPVYESALTLGIDAAAIEGICRSGANKFMNAVAKQLNPNLSYQLIKFRSTPDGHCEEAIVLA